MNEQPPPPPPPPPTEALAVLSDGISLVLSRWTALQIAVENQWGGRESRAKADELANAILFWFSQTQPPLYIDELEDIFYENMVLSFNAEIEDGSVEEVAEQLMIMHEECLQGNYESISKLRGKNPAGNAVSMSKRAADDESSDDEDDEEADAMEVEPKPSTSVPEKLKPRQAAPDEEGWIPAPTRRSHRKGRQ